jgi:hypothetical protein
VGSPTGGADVAGVAGVATSASEDAGTSAVSGSGVATRLGALLETRCSSITEDEDDADWARQGLASPNNNMAIENIITIPSLLLRVIEGSFTGRNVSDRPPRLPLSVLTVRSFLHQGEEEIESQSCRIHLLVRVLAGVVVVLIVSVEFDVLAHWE